MIEETFSEIEDKMKKTLDATVREFGRTRTGRATPELLDGIQPEVYGSSMPLKQLATIAVPQPRVLKISPFDPKNISSIERAISMSDLGIQPRNDGRHVIVEIPALTEERRKELAKVVRKKGEEKKVAIRNIRRDGNDEVKMMEEEKEISEDEMERALKKIQEMTDKYVEKAEDLIKKKEKEIMEF
jgi:ribosome recycling factor